VLRGELGRTRAAATVGAAGAAAVPQQAIHCLRECKRARRQAVRAACVQRSTRASSAGASSVVPSRLHLHPCAGTPRRCTTTPRIGRWTTLRCRATRCCCWLFLVSLLPQREPVLCTLLQVCRASCTASGCKPSAVHTPACAQSFLHGKWVQAQEPAAVALGSSRGHETPTSKLAMRLTVVASDLLGGLPDFWSTAQG